MNLMPAREGVEEGARHCLCVPPRFLLPWVGIPRITDLRASPWLDRIGCSTCQHRAQAFPRHHRAESSSVFQERTDAESDGQIELGVPGIQPTSRGCAEFL